MKQIFFKTMSYISMFTLGLYASSQFLYNEPVELYRWVITSFTFLFWLVLVNDKKIIK